MNTKTKIIIPIYKANLSTLEFQSLRRNYSVLKSYDIVVIKPESLDLSLLKAEFKDLTFESFDDIFFQGIDGYNKLMMNSDFYKRFLDVDYILICQLDVYIFRDDLSYFLNKDYDYIGAPWLVRKLYRYLPFLEYIKLIHKKYSRKDITWPQNKNRVGNGGLSLRKVESFYKASLLYSDRINAYISHKGSSVFNEDVFWAKEPHEFKYPSTDEALKFAFDKYPRQCFQENGNTLPMGCHGWYKWKWKGFWKSYIEFEDK